MAGMAPSPLRAHFDTMRRRRILASVAFLTVLAATIPCAVGVPDLYSASASLLVEGQTLPAPGLYLSQLDDRLQAIKQEALSRTRLSELIQRFNLYSGMQPAQALQRIQRDIQVDVTGTSPENGRTTTAALKLSYVGTNSATVAKVTNALASFYVIQNDKLRSQAATSRAQFLKNSLDDAKKKLDTHEKRVADFTRQNVGALPQQFSVDQAAITRISAELQGNTNEQMRLREHRQTLLTQIADLRKNPGADVSDPAAALAARTRELAALRLNETDDSPNVKAKQREIAALTAQLAAMNRSRSDPDIAQLRQSELGKDLADTESQLQKLAHDYQAARNSMNMYQARLEKAPVRNTELEAIMMDYRLARDLYDSLQKRYDEAQMGERAQQVDGGVEQIRILDDALEPTVPVGPNRLRLIAGGFVLALIMAIGLAFVVDWFDTSFHSLKELRAFTNVPVLASIPLIETDTDWTWKVCVRCLLAAAMAVVLVGVGMVAFRLAQGSDFLSRTLLRL